MRRVKKIAEELFQTLRENHPLNELILLSDDAKLFLLLHSLAPIQGISQEVCDALFKQVCPASQKGEHLEVYNNVLFHILKTTELDPLDKEYLLLRILKEPAPVPCMRLIVGIKNTGGFTFLQKNRLEKGSFRDILRETCRDILREACKTDNGPLSPIRQCSQKAQAHNAETDPIPAELIAEILHSDGFKKEEARDLNYDLQEGQSIAEVQGTTALCEKTLRHAIEKPAVLSPSSLRALDTPTSRILRMKRFGHAYNLKGLVNLPNNTRVNLEGFNETFVIPMLRAMFNEFALNRPDLVTPTLSAFVKESLSKALWHDNASEEKIDEIHKLIHDPTYDYPVVVGLGWIWHSMQAIFYMGNLYYCNRGADSKGRPGVSVFNIENKEKITPEFLKRIASRLSVEYSAYTSLEKIKEELEAFDTQYKCMKMQKVGNCVYSNAKALISTLLQIGSLKETTGTCPNQIYKAFSQFDKETVLEDFLIDLEEASTGNVGMEKNPSYLEGVATVTKLFKKWAIDHAGKNQKISSDLFVKAFTLICETG